MARTRLTPPLGVRGRFTVAAPFTVLATKVYEVVALRYFDDVVAEGDNVFDEYYDPVGLTTVEYQADERVGAVIVSLADPEGQILYIPDTYITSFPNQTDFVYHHLILNVSLGILPSYLDLTYAKDEIKGVVDKVLGIDSVIHLAAAPAQGLISPTQHQSLEAARAAAIEMNESVHARNLRLQASLQSALEQNNVYRQILIDNGILPE